MSILPTDSSHIIDGLLQLRRLQEASADRAESGGRGFNISDARYFRKIHSCVYATSLGDVFFARLSNNPVAALAYIRYGQSGITVRSGSSREGYQHYAMYLLQFAVIEDARARGLTRLNIGGVPEAAVNEEDHPQHGLHEFKKGIGGDAYLRHSVSMKVAET